MLYNFIFFCLFSLIGNVEKENWGKTLNTFMKKHFFLQEIWFDFLDFFILLLYFLVMFNSISSPFFRYMHYFSWIELKSYGKRKYKCFSSIFTAWYGFISLNQVSDWKIIFQFNNKLDKSDSLKLFCCYFSGWTKIIFDMGPIMAWSNISGIIFYEKKELQANPFDDKKLCNIFNKWLK